MTNTPDKKELTPLQRALLALDKMQAKITQLESEKHAPIAILGMGCRLPKNVNTPDEFWEFLKNGTDGISKIGIDRYDVEALYDEDPDEPGTVTTKWAGLYDHVDLFDPTFFGISPKEATQMDPQQRMLLEVAYEALEAGGQALEKLRGSATGVFIGIHSQSSDYGLMQYAELDRIGAYVGTGTAHSIMANRISYLFDFQGPSLAVDTACSSSLISLHLAVQSLRQKECDLALAGGANSLLWPDLTVASSRLHMMAADGRCKTFDARADGFVRGEGAGIIVLKRLDEAVRDGDPIMAVIRGTATNQDGSTNGLTAPNSLSQKNVIRKALKDARVKPADITYVETHGTGTSLGDPIEVEALTDVIGAPRPDGQICSLGAVKSNIGHLEGAAGIAGVMKAILCLQHKHIPQNLHFETLNPYLSFDDSRLEPATLARDWKTVDGLKRFAGVSSFGMGGTNGHVILSEAPTEITDVVGEIPAVLPLLLSAPTKGDLRRVVEHWQAWLTDQDASSFEEIAFTAAGRRSHHFHRLAFIGDSIQDWLKEINLWLDENTSKNTLIGTQKDALSLQLVSLFVDSKGIDDDNLALTNDDGVYQVCLELLEAQNALTPETKQVAYQIAKALAWKNLGVTPALLVGSGLNEFVALIAGGLLPLKMGIKALGQLALNQPVALNQKTLAKFKASRRKGKFYKGIPVFSDLLGKTLSSNDITDDYLNKLKQNILTDAASKQLLDRISADNYQHFLIFANDSGTTKLIQQSLSKRTNQDEKISVWPADLLSKTTSNQKSSLLDHLLDMQLEGFAINWNYFFRKGLKLANLPSWPWHHQSYWFNSPGRRLPGQVDAVATPAEWLYKTDWHHQAIETAKPDSTKRFVLVTSNADEAKSLSNELPNSLIFTPVGNDYHQNGNEVSGKLSDLSRVVAENKSAKYDVVYLCSTDENNPSNLYFGDTNVMASAADPQVEVTNLLHLYQTVKTVADSGIEITLRLVSAGGWMTADTDDCVNYRQAAAWGLGNTLALESPELWAGMIDLDLADSSVSQARNIVNELHGSAGEDQVAFRDGKRLLPRLVQAEALPPAVKVIKPNVSYVIIGGMGGLGFGLARWMIAQGATDIVLTGRTALPAEELWASLTPEHPAYDKIVQIQELADLGAKITPVAVDVTNLAATKTLFDRFGNDLPALRGVIHAAVAVDICSADEIDDAKFKSVLEAKMEGALVLDKVTESADLDFFVLFSSVASVLGRLDLSSYSAGNAFLDAFAHNRKSRGLPATAINWGAWEVMRAIDQNEKDLIARSGLLLMEFPPAMDMMMRLIRSGVPQRMVADVNWDNFKPAYESRREMPLLSQIGLADLSKTADKSEAESQLLNSLLDLPDHEQKDALRLAVNEMIGEIMDRPAGDLLDEERGLFELGLDSLMAVQLRKKLEAGLGIKLPGTLVFNYPNINAITDLLMERLPILGANEDTPVQQPANIEDQVDDLSEDELAALLDDELSDLLGDD